MGDIYFIPEIQNIDKSLELCRRYNGYFEYNDFMLPSVLDDENKVAELVAFYMGLERDRSNDTLHGAFLDVTVHSDDAMIYEASQKRVRQSMDIAKRLGIKAVIFHTNFIPNFRVAFYQKNWLERNVQFWNQILEEYPELCVYIENMFDEEPDMLSALAKRMEGVPRFGVCFDYAHAVVFGHDLMDWATQLGPYTKHMHINDNDLKDDLHMNIGEGKIDWNEFTNLMKEKSVEATVLLEMRGCENQEKSVEYIKQHKIYPCDEVAKC